MRKLIRQVIMRLLKNDFVDMIEEHREDLIAIFRDEMERLDDRIPEEQAFIDINMGHLGEEIMKATLTTVTRFIRQM